MPNMKLIGILNADTLETQPLEIVERKGLGHPDTIMDSMVDALSVALNQEYLRKWNTILHYNVDKGLLAAGSSKPAFNGGIIEKPMRMFFGDRATTCVDGDCIDLDSILKETTKNWIKKNLRFVDPEEHIVIQNDIERSSGNLSDIFRRGGAFLGANDTSACVGFAPMTRTEKVVLETEHFLNSPSFKKSYPETGEDIKVMARRVKDSTDLTISIAFVDRFIDSEVGYFRKKEEVKGAIEAFLRERGDLKDFTVTINNLDATGRGVDGLYLTVLGTSAESGDSGQVGRGNRVNGLFSLNRPLSSEASSGKNPVSHVGKIYNAMAFRVAEHLIQEVEGIEEAYFWLLSKIGRPVNEPALAAAYVVPKKPFNEKEVKAKVSMALEDALTDRMFQTLIEKLISGEIKLC